MTKVNINGHSHQVEVDHDGDLDEVIGAAKKLWEQTVQPQRGPAGPAYGFTAELRGAADLNPMDADGR